MPKFTKVFRYNRAKLRDFIITVIAALFTGAIIGLFLSLKISNQISSSLAIILILFFLFLFYMLGKYLVIYIIKNNKSVYNFHINFVGGIFSSLLVSLLLLFYQSTILILGIAIVALIFLYLLAYFTIQIKRAK